MLSAQASLVEWCHYLSLAALAVVDFSAFIVPGVATVVVAIVVDVV